MTRPTHPRTSGIPPVVLILFASLPIVPLIQAIFNSTDAALISLAAWLAMAAPALGVMHWAHVQRRLRRGVIVLAPVLRKETSKTEEGHTLHHVVFRITMPETGEAIVIQDSGFTALPRGHLASILTDTAYPIGHPMRAQRVTFGGLQVPTFLMLMAGAVGVPFLLWRLVAAGWLPIPGWPAS